MAWSYGFATCVGAVHGNEAVGQDYALCATVPATNSKDVLIAAVSDGAGSTSLGGVGAKVACHTFVAAASDILNARKSKNDLHDSELCTIFNKVVIAIADKAATDKQPLDQYSCTLVAAVLFDKQAIFLQVGDGGATFRTDIEFEVALWPEKSEFVNTTFFLTNANARDHLQVRRVPAKIAEVALFTDGLQYMLLDFKDLVPHQPFFRTVSSKLTGVPAGEAPAFSAWLKKVLESGQVKDRSDDDTSIIFARRVAKP